MSSSKPPKTISHPELPGTLPVNKNQQIVIIKKTETSREIRQLRMFKAILIIMITFFICRLPTWIYLLYKLFNVANTNLHWVLQYIFGILSIFNCVLNPLLYTFLTETMHCSFVFLDKLKKIRFVWSKKKCATENQRDADTETGFNPVNNAELRNKFYCSEDLKVKLARLD